MDLVALSGATNFEHSRMVSKISGLLARYAGFSRQEVELIEEAALFHDIGKCDIPPEILNKPGALTTQEFEMIKTHTQRGYDRIEEVLSVLSAAALIAKNHHERWNGTGYQRLTAGEIHPYARLVAVADVFDALISKRAYKDSWDKSEVLGYLKTQSGIQFDEEIIAALFAHSDELLALYA